MRVSCTLIAALAAVAACSSELPPQGQVVLALDTDAPLADPPLFDRVLVELFPPAATTPCADCARELPIDVAKVRERRFSFGFAPRPREVGWIARLRMFRSAGLGVPRPGSTIELVGYLPAVAEDGVVTLTATFHAEDVGRPRGTFRAPIVFDRGLPAASAEGTWAPGRTVPCVGSAPIGAACVPGGAFFMGDPRVSVTDGALGGAKEHLVVLAPYFLDEHEVTVGDLRASGLAQIDSRGKSLDPIDDLADDVGGRCDYSSQRGKYEDRPVDCVSWQLAQAYCQKKGGDLPTEAQVERVASAQGTRLAPWGDGEPACDEAAVSRNLTVEQGGCSTADPLSLATRVIPEPPGSGSRDRVGTIVDLGANLAEWTLDGFEGDDGACWSAPLLVDPVCVGDGKTHSSKGGDLARVPVDFAQARRSRTTENRAATYADVGFRCAYPAK